MNKKDLVKSIVDALKVKAGHHLTAAKSAHAEATHEESKAEDKYDTRGLEAGYLAVGQARMMDEAANAIRAYEMLFLKKFDPKAAIDLAALVEMTVNKKAEKVFIGPAGGGIEVMMDGGPVLVVTPESPLGALMMGKKVGDRFTRKVGPFEDAYRIISIT